MLMGPRYTSIYLLQHSIRSPEPILHGKLNVEESLAGISDELLYAHRLVHIDDPTTIGHD